MTFESLTDRPKSLFIGGEWRAARGNDRILVTNPSTGTPFAEILAAEPADVTRAIDAASAAFAGWAARPAAVRAAFLRGFADGLSRHSEALIGLQMLNNGKPRAEAEIDLADAQATFRYYAQMAEDLDRRQYSPVDLGVPGSEGFTRFEPVGPVGMIVPWNFPLVTSAWKIAPALAAGCTVVLKTSEFTPLIELIYGDIAAEIGLPAGVLNLITGAASAGAALTADTRLRKISFTGSNMVGSRVMGAAAARCLPVSLELGGKSPIVVLADADLDRAVDCIIGGIFFNCGQMCSATSRLIVEDQIADALLDRLVARTKALHVGAPTDPASEMGPITTRAQYRMVLDILESARASGLTLLAGGQAAEMDAGFFVQPTIFADVPAEHPVWREEVFGPVLAVRRVRGEAEAVAAANDSDYGLVASIISADTARAKALAAKIDAGHIWVNSLQFIPPNTAWGGFKASGIGRELGPWGLSAYLGVKHLSVTE